MMRLTLPTDALVGKEGVDEVTAGERANIQTDCNHSRDILGRYPTLYISPKCYAHRPTPWTYHRPTKVCMVAAFTATTPSFLGIAIRSFFATIVSDTMWLLPDKIPVIVQSTHPKTMDETRGLTEWHQSSCHSRHGASWVSSPQYLFHHHGFHSYHITYAWHCQMRYRPTGSSYR